MRLRWIGTTMLLTVIGCSGEPAARQPTASEKVKLTAPGVKVEVDKKAGSVDVVAPGANVKVEK